MAKNVCPGCKEVVLGLGLETAIKCTKCGTVFEVQSAKNNVDTSLELIINKWLGRLGTLRPTIAYGKN